MTLFVVCTWLTPHCGSRPKIKNLLSHFGSPRQMLSKVVWHDLVAPTTTEEIDSREKGLVAGPVLQGGDWALVLPTPKLATTSLLSPEIFSKSIHLFKSCSWFSKIQTHRQTDGRTDGRTDGQRDRQTHKFITPVPHKGTGKKKLCPVFSTYHKTFRSG